MKEETNTVVGIMKSAAIYASACSLYDLDSLY